MKFGFLKWYHQESNRDTRIFSPLLTNELWHHTLTDDFSFAGAKGRTKIGSTKFLGEKLFKKDKKVLFYLVLCSFGVPLHRLYTIGTTNGI